jgi:pentatricopeptide repeat protein
MEAYITSLDLAAALSVAIIMHESGLKVSADSIGPIYFFLVQDPDRPMEAFNMLRNFEAKGRKVPVAAVNVCLQASVHLRRLEEAIEIYKALHTVVKSGPNTDTFNILFQGCHRAARKELAMFLASEMTQIGLKPNRITYDRLVLVCVQSGDLDDAMLYYEEMRGQGWGMRRGTFEAVIWRGIEVGDVRMVGVLREMVEAGFEPREELVKGVKARFEDAPVKNASEGTEEGLTVPVVDAMSGVEGRVMEPVMDALSGMKKKPFEVVQDLLSGHEDMHMEPPTREASTNIEGVFTGSSPDSLRSADVKKPAGRVVADASTVVEESLAKPVQGALLASGVDKAVAEPIQNSVSEVVAGEKSGKEVTNIKAGEVEEKRPEEDTATQEESPEQAFQKMMTGEDSVKP